MLHSVLFLKIISCTCCLLNEYNITPNQTHINQANCLEHRKRNWLLKSENTSSNPSLVKSLLNPKSPGPIYREILSAPCTHLPRLLHQNLYDACNATSFERWNAFFQKWDERLAKMVDTLNKWHRQYWLWKLFYEVVLIIKLEKVKNMLQLSQNSFLQNGNFLLSFTFFLHMRVIGHYKSN